MHKIRMILLATTLISSQATLANTPDIAGGTGSKPCAILAHKCAAAGFVRVEAGKNFWLDCMKPVLIGHSVHGITIDSADVQACRADKIAEFKKELYDLEQVKPAQ